MGKNGELHFTRPDEGCGLIGEYRQGEATRTKKKQAATVAAYKILMQLEVV